MKKIIKKIGLMQAFLCIQGKRVVSELMKIIDGETYYSIVFHSGPLNDERIDVFGPEVLAVEVFYDIMARALKGPVGETYMFVSDEEREEELAKYKQCI